MTDSGNELGAKIAFGLMFAPTILVGLTYPAIPEAFLHFTGVPPSSANVLMITLVIIITPLLLIPHTYITIQDAQTSEQEVSADE